MSTPNRPTDVVVTDVFAGRYISAPMPDINDNCPVCDDTIRDGQDWRFADTRRVHSWCLASYSGNVVGAAAAATPAAEAISTSTPSAPSNPSSLPMTDRYVEVDFDKQGQIIGGLPFIRVPNDPVDPYTVGTRVLVIDRTGTKSSRYGWVSNISPGGDDHVLVRIPTSGSADAGSDPAACFGPSSAVVEHSPSLSSLMRVIPSFAPSQHREAKSKADLKNRFSYHPPTDEQVETYARIRSQAKAYAYMLADLVPDSRERELALTHLEQVVMFANAAVARHPVQSST